MTRSIRLRPWQKSALEQFNKVGSTDFLAVATPGAGKTTFALAAARQEIQQGNSKRLIVVTPTAHLKRQWAAAAAALDLHLESEWSQSKGTLPADMHGIVTTYHQVASSTGAIRKLAHGSFSVFDELHHAGYERAWGEALQEAFTGASRRLALSGTPFRSDILAIPFVNYEYDEAAPDFEYGYGEALSDGRVVRPVYFPRTNGHMEWSAPDGVEYSATFDDPMGALRANQRLRTALSLEGQWLPEVLEAAQERLMEARKHQPNAAGLVIAIDQEHARGIARIIQEKFKTKVTVATSDDPDASSAISRFAKSSDPWIVAVRMVSEGVDIPRLRVGVYATTTTTELFFRQAVGRLVRWQPGVTRQRAYLFIPDDPRLRLRAAQIAERRRHSLRRKSEQDDDAEGELFADPLDHQDQSQLSGADDEGGQLSLFAVISAVATDAVVPPEDDHFAEDHHDGEEDPSLVLELTALPHLHTQLLRNHNGASSQDGGTVWEGTRTEFKAHLRDANAQLARALARKTGWPHAQVNSELNRLSGLRKITEATATQLETRLAHAKRWMDRM